MPDNYTSYNMPNVINNILFKEWDKPETLSWSLFLRAKIHNFIEQGLSQKLLLVLKPHRLNNQHKVIWDYKGQLENDYKD